MVAMIAGIAASVAFAVIALAQENQPPVASFNFTPLEPHVEEQVAFDASSSYDPDSTIEHYEWDFDDNGVIDASGMRVSYRFPLSGQYVVKLVVIDDQGFSASRTELLKVTQFASNVTLSNAKVISAVGLNLGANLNSLGGEVGIFKVLRLGIAAYFTGEVIPDYYEVEPPAQPWPDELIYNDGPEIEAYLKLIAPLGERVALAVSGGLAVQEQVHLAVSPSGSSLPQDATIKPNGYKTTENYLTALAGIVLKIEPLLIELGYHSRRGWLVGIGIEL